MTKRERTYHLLFLALLAAIFGYGLVTALGFFPGGRFFPVTATAIGLACCGALALHLFWGAEAGAALDASTKPAEFSYAALFFLAFGFYIAVVYATGFFPATALALLVFLRGYARVGLVASACVTGATLGGTYLFGILLNISWPRGVLSSLV
ncbi:tripartite tricarboxylate transporter TctB family protein [Stappia stellulata]|uniref:tripartite tricarboxylate transporter TctB family protein n=1 Tax=Stappia stellulata TaxID=71235 RepID=UPI0003F64595|nr:tripartite tricarboxylate transporter TctB family protein [Stappia stellulata]